MRTQLSERQQPASPRVSKRRAQSNWNKTQQEMVSKISEHAIEGGRASAGDQVDKEAAIDAYLDMLRQDLLAFAKRDTRTL